MATFGFRNMRTIYIALLFVLATFYGYVAYVIFHPDYSSRAYRLYYVDRVIRGLPGERYDLTYILGADAEPRHYGRAHGGDRKSLYFVLAQDIPDGMISLYAWVDSSIHADMGDEGISADVRLMVNDHELGPYPFIFDKSIGSIEMQFPAELLVHGLNEVVVLAPELELTHQRQSVKPRIIPEQIGEEDASRMSYVGGTNWRGDWAPRTDYHVNDVVIYRGRTYRCLTFHNSHTATRLLTQLDDWHGPGETLYLWHLQADTGQDGDDREFIYAVTDGSHPVPTSNTWGYDDPGLGWEDEPPPLMSNLHTLWRAERNVIGAPTQYDLIDGEWSNPKIVGRWVAGE